MIDLSQAEPVDPQLAEAASIAFAMLRFEMGAANTRFTRGAGEGTLGVDTFIFLPVGRPVSRDLVVPYLASCPSPVLLVPTTTAGVVTLLLLSELESDRRQWAQHIFDNYLSIHAEKGEQLNLSAESRVVMEFDEEAHVFSWGTLALMLERFAVQVAFNLLPMSYNDPRGTVRMMLYRSDGERSWGSSCPWRPKEEGSDSNERI
jgi:hypothetical protein